jgi:outer membrane protein TolC
MSVRKKILVAVVILLTTYSATAQKDVVKLSLSQAINMATDSSLTAFKYKNQYLSGYWEYRTYKAQRLPSLTLSLTPASYSRYLTQRYDSEQDIDVFREQRSYLASGGLTLMQNFDPIGGTFYIESNVDYLRNFGDVTYNQFTAVPIRVGYSHSMFGYNQFKWDKKIEPLKYETAKLQYLYNAEQIALTSVSYFFNLALAQAQLDLAREQSQACDTLLSIGERRFKIGSISKSELLSLNLDAVNARSAIARAEVEVRRARLTLATFVGMDVNKDIVVELPGAPTILEVDPANALAMMHKNSYMIALQMQNILYYEQNLDRTNKETRFSASLNASVGFNQESEAFKNVYNDPMRQELVSVSLSVPLLDWGVGRGKRNIAHNELNVAKIEAQQKIAELEQELILTINELAIHRDLLSNSEEAYTLAHETYKETRQRFQTGSGDVASLTLAQERLLAAQNSYIESMHNYWICYYELRQLTLFDPQTGFSLSEQFDFNLLTE